MTVTIDVVGARAGHGTSTVAAAIALALADHAPTLLVAHDMSDTCGLLGLAEPGDANVAPINHELTVTAGIRADHDAAFIVSDRWDDDDRWQPSLRLAVLRGPCYLGLRTLTRPARRRADGIVLVAEAGRALTRGDVEDVTGVPVVASVAASPAVARTIDAGLLVARGVRLREFAELRRFLLFTFDLAAPTELRPVVTVPVGPALDDPTDHFHLAPVQSPTNGTDLPVPLSGTGRTRNACPNDGRRRALLCLQRWRPTHAQHRQARAGRGGVLPG